MKKRETRHVPVMLEEVVGAVAAAKGARGMVVVDCTVGAGGAFGGDIEADWDEMGG